MLAFYGSDAGIWVRGRGRRDGRIYIIVFLVGVLGFTFGGWEVGKGAGLANWLSRMLRYRRRFFCVFLLAISLIDKSGNPQGFRGVLVTVAFPWQLIDLVIWRNWPWQ